MAKACVSRNMGIDLGMLSIEKWSTVRHVYDQTFTSVGDGAFTEQTTLPGKLMIDTGIQSWVSDSPLPTKLLMRVQRDRRDLRVSNPNAVQIRDRVTTTVNGTDPRVPDVSSTYQGQTGASIDTSANYVGLPFYGYYWVYEDAALIEDWIDPVAPGATFKFWYRCNLWTPPPWTNNASGGLPVHTANVRSVRIQLLAFPTQDAAVTP